MRVSCPQRKMQVVVLPFLILLLLITAGGCRSITAWPLQQPAPGTGPRWGVAFDGYPITGQRLLQVAAETGHEADLAVFFLAWPEHGNVPGKFPRDTLDAISRAGAIPCLTWEPMWIGAEGAENVIPVSDILEGEYDVYLKAFAKELTRWRQPLIIRFAHEMNLARYHWGGTAADYGPSTPELYRRMFRYVVEICRRQGADNVLWAFCPNAESVPQADWNWIAAYYPGDQVVDLLGIDGYNWGTTQTVAEHGWNSRWQSFQEIFAQPRSELLALAPEKPLMIFETASVTQGGSQEQWLAEALQTARLWGIAAITWFQAEKENDWRMQPATRQILQEWK